MMIRSILQNCKTRAGCGSIGNVAKQKPNRWQNSVVVGGDGFRRGLATTSIATSLDPTTDRLLVVGSGVAGSAAALIAAETYQIPVTLLFAGNTPEDCNSNWAQGGIIYRNYHPSANDSAEALARDIHHAGAGLCDDPAVRKVAEEGPDRVRQLLLNDNNKENGVGPFASVPFDRQPSGDLSLCLEASHSAPRILHYADHTGMIITQHMTMAAARHPLITLQPQTVVTDLVVEENQCIGVTTLNRASGKRAVELGTRGTVLCSGGLAGIYEHSTNPAGFNALGSSVALATRANVATKDLEYVQFHPTSLYIPNEARFLLTEALRGEGAILRNASGRAFAQDFHPDGELAPRDIVARGVFEESQKQCSADKQHNVFLDITHRDKDWLHARFPSIQAHLGQRGYDLAKDQLPIIPAAHYTCGGITTDLHGRTNLKGLYAAGEAARTGLHGGNRLASTSLLEGLVFGSSVADYIASDAGRELDAQAKETLSFGRDSSSSTSMLGEYHRRDYYHHSKLEPIQIENAAYRAMQLLLQVRRVMWDHVGLVRTPSGLATALQSLGEIHAEAAELYRICPTMETTGLRDAVCAGEAVAAASLANRQSAGAHYIVPDGDDDMNIADDFSDDDDEEAVAASQ